MKVRASAALLAWAVLLSLGCAPPSGAPDAVADAASVDGTRDNGGDAPRDVGGDIRAIDGLNDAIDERAPSDVARVDVFDSPSASEAGDAIADTVDVRDVAIIDSGLDLRRGDRCPAIPVPTDGSAVLVNTSAFATSADTGTSCGSAATPANWVDVVFEYTLSATRDVTVTINGTGVGPVAMELQTTCGLRSSALMGCTLGGPARRLFRSQAAGSYVIVAEYSTALGAAARTLTVTVETAAPTVPAPGDVCPGSRLGSDGIAVSVDASLLAPDYPLSCLGAARADVVFQFDAPPSGSDALFGVTTATPGSTAGMNVFRTCAAMPVDPCLSRGTIAGGVVWNRYRGLAAGTSYTLVAATSSASGTLSATYFAIPAASPTAVTGNDRCAGARLIPETGGIFTGTTAGSATDVPLPAGCAMCGGGAPDVVYQLTLTSRRHVIFNMLGSSYDTVLFVQQGVTCPGTPIPGACNDDAYRLASAVDTTLDPGTYWVIVHGCGATASGTYTLDVAVVPP